ncbi:hypothetical protein EV182_006763 [Spiromyces aspiralis]|uniref:Uncharacterized protein n=1 Tax=Spiromyces aspiralis TaxID=68401 RepID=A0ACC1HL30_9FUNG|nr:hypothetical protein EV182_006763 [Spiromyces aspiralis]
MQHCESLKRRVHLVNLDPAAENFEYTPAIGVGNSRLYVYVFIYPHFSLCCVDIRELITLEDVMDELEYGPNGGLIYCFE